MNNVLLAALSALHMVTTWVGPTHADDVGFMRLTIADPMGGNMLVSVWYPTLEPGSRITVGPFSFNAARDAEPLVRQQGLVVISHGTEGSDLGHRNIAIALARRGLIAAAPLHPRDNFNDNSGVGHRVVMEGRPRQLSAVIDALVEHKDWRGRVDPSRIGAFGFSLGGYTVLSALGALPDMMRIAEHCEGPTTDPFCDAVGLRGASLRQHVQHEFSSPMTGLADNRLCAALIADPVAVPFSNEALAGIATRHIQVWRPEHQNVLLAEAHASRVVEQLNKRSFAEVTVDNLVEGAQHYSFLAPFPQELELVLPLFLTQDPEGFDRASFQERFADEVASFLTQSLEACANST